jgi:hypothetical protein
MGGRLMLCALKQKAMREELDRLNAYFKQED